MVLAATEIGLKPKMFGGGMVGLQATVFKNKLGPKLNGIINYAEMIEEELVGRDFDQVCEDARKIRRLGAQLNGVVDHIFDLVEMEKRAGVNEDHIETPES